MSGFGSATFGSAPFGSGTPVSATDMSGVPFEVPDAGTYSGSRFIDYRTGDYVLGDDGRLEGMADVAQLVQLALAALQLAGGRLTENTEGDIRRRVDAALAHLVGSGQVRVDDVVFERFAPGGLKTTVRWTDLTTGQERKANVGRAT